MEKVLGSLRMPLPLPCIYTGLSLYLWLLNSLALPLFSDLWLTCGLLPIKCCAFGARGALCFVLLLLLLDLDLLDTFSLKLLLCDLFLKLDVRESYDLLWPFRDAGSIPLPLFPLSRKSSLSPIWNLHCSWRSSLSLVLRKLMAGSSSTFFPLW